MREVLSRLIEVFNTREQFFVEREIELVLAAEVPGRLRAGAVGQARIRTRFLSEFGAYTAGELADLIQPHDSSALNAAEDWEAGGHIFSVVHRRARLYPAFQFEPSGSPRPVVARVLRHLGDWPTWDLAEWFVVPNRYLDQRRPVELLGFEQGEVVRAAAFDAKRVLHSRR